MLMQLSRWTILRAIALALIACAACLPAQAADGRERLSLDRGWLFHLGDVPFDVPTTGDETYLSTKAGNASGAAGIKYDDSAWRKLDLPHDWAIEGLFDPKANVAQGYRRRGIAWYRRDLALPESDRGRHIELEFGAIATHATVWVNGNLVNRNWSGYNEIRIDITPYLQYGDGHLNTIAVRVDAEQMEGWWYEGAGIYRHSWLVKSDAVHVVADGLRAVARPAAAGAWSIPAALTLDNDGKQASRVDVEVSVTDPSGKEVARRSSSVVVPVLTQVTVELPLTVARPLLWSLASRSLYHVTATVRRAGKVIDRVALDTGFRAIRFDAARGFFLNGEHVKLKGVCLHQDHAGVGVAVPLAIWEYRLRRLQELGVNAIRFSHNAIAAEVLDLADRMGFLVMAENRNFNPSPDYMKQFEWMLKRDRHHPSVILWSVFNEEPMQATEAGYEMARRMVALANALDGTRPTTAAMSFGMLTPLNVSHAVDVVGANYQIREYDKYHAANPGKPFTSSEDTSAFMTRGEFVTDKARHIATSYDEESGSWGNTHRDAWQAIDTRDFVAGAFVWTGFDYHGEPTPYTWPSANSFFGIMDINGFPKTAYYMHQVQWIKDRPLVYIAPHWNWAGREGQEIRVRVMANVERVKLLHNGREIGERKNDNHRMNDFMVPYAPGKLEAIGYNGAREVARASVETTGPAVALELVPDRAALAGDGRDAMPITVRAVDAQGRPVPTTNDEVSFEVSGAGRSIGHGNGDPNSHEDEKGKTRKLFNGLAQLIVQSGWDSSGAIAVRASAPGLKPAALDIPVKAVPAVPFVAPPPPIVFDNPLLRQRADPFVLRHGDGNYYFTATVPEYDRIELRRARDLNGLSTAETKVVWRKHDQGPMSYHIWAPELHRVNGKWIIYFSAGRADDHWAIRPYALENAAADPLQGEWKELGPVKTGWDSFSLDATTFSHRGKRYYVWVQAGRTPDEGKGTNIYIAEMDSATTIRGKVTLLTKPEYPWETVKFAVNEAPAVLVSHGKVWLTYSASATDANYAMGMLSADAGADLLDAASWTKSPQPVFKTSEANGQYGPGHNSFTTAPDGKTDVLVYHARDYRDIQGDSLNDPNRHTRAQVIRWKADGSPDFGEPVPNLKQAERK